MHAHPHLREAIDRTRRTNLKRSAFERSAFSRSLISARSGFAFACQHFSLSPNFCAKNAELHLSQRKSKAGYLSGIVHSQRVRINHEHLRPRVPNQAHSPESEPISSSLEASLITSDPAAVA